MFKTAKTYVIVVAALASFGANAANIGLDNNAWYTSTLADSLIAQGNTVTLVDSYDTASLSQFNAFIQDGNGYFNNAALDSFVLNGGTLVELPWSLGQNSNYGGPLSLINNPSYVTFGSPNPGVNVLNSASYLLKGVSLPAANSFTVGYEVGTSFTGNGNAVLAWNDGSALLAESAYGAGHVVAFNLHLITSDSSPLNATWSNQIVSNAVAAVPEPETYAMLLAGLGLIGAAVKRRKAKQA